VALFGGTLIALVIMVEIVQLRGLIFSTEPLKPDFSRLNPAQGLKRIFSMKMLKEAGKSVAKTLVYTIVAMIVVQSAVNTHALAMTDASHVASALSRAGTKLIYVFLLVAIPFAMLDQVLARGSFAKQMMMSRREVTRETKDREGDPRIKSKRKQIHAGFVKQAKGLANLPGSDLLIVNPVHYAVALKYTPDEMDAPIVTAKGSDKHAMQLRMRALQFGIPIFESPALARDLFRTTAMDDSISTEYFHAVADLYFKLRASKGERA
jgi:flagellar biosynthetic protein FlhB